MLACLGEIFENIFRIIEKEWDFFFVSFCKYTTKKDFLSK